MGERGNQDRWAEVIGPCVGRATAAALLGVTPAQIDRRRGRSLLGVRVQQRWVYPLSQFRSMADGTQSIAMGFDDVLAEFGPTMGGLAVARWMATPNRRLDGATPWEALDSSGNAVVAAAASQAQAWGTHAT